jgi:mannose-6-phosphate isomerase-like protein (cupin superfamily)
MQRRSFLKTVAAVAPAACLPDFLGAASHSQTAAPATPALHVVGAGDDRFGNPHATGFSSLAFKVSGSETGGRMFIMEHTHLLPGGPPLHTHLNQEEWFFVEEGEVAFQIGEQRLHLKAGASVLAPRRVPHTFSSVGTAPARMIIAFCPAGKMEAYFNDVQAHKEHANDAEFWRQYEMELVGPSPFWKS